MSGPVSCHLPVDASLHSFNSLDYGFGAGESPFLAGSADATCGVAAVRAVSQYLNLEPMRAGVSFADTPGQLAQPAPSEALVARERDAARGDRPWEEQQLGVDALTASGRTGAAEDVSTSHDVAEAFPPLNFGDLDVEQQADALFSKGPMRTLSARTFETLLDESNVRENEEWTALQNLPSLPRDVTALGADDLAPSAPTPSRPARAAGDFDFEYDDAEDRDLTGTSSRGGAKGSEVPEYLDLEAASIEEARARAAQARARAEEARRAATRATANATTLTIRAKEILDAVSGAKEKTTRTSMSRARSAGSPRGKARASAKASSLSRESSGVRTPTRSERGGVDIEPASADADVSSPAATRARKRSSREPVGEPARSRDAGDSTDMEDSDATEPAALPPRAAKRAKPSAVAWAPKATDNIITADGQKVRRGCLNCGCQKTPQWRMGPTGPKTLCNACGVRFRKGMPMHE